MLAPFSVIDYTPHAVSIWLTADWSLLVALLSAAVMYLLGGSHKTIRMPVLAFVIAFAPLALWVWDIPFSGRIICRFLHDGRAGFYSRHLYIVGAGAWFPVLILLRRQEAHGFNSAWLNPETAVRW